jgi:hypothetical protein
MKSRFLIVTLLLAVMCIGSAGNAMAQSVTGTGVFGPGLNGAPLTATVSAQQGGNGGVLRFGQAGIEIVANPVDICVEGNAAFVVGEITHVSGDFFGVTEGQFLELGFVDNGKDGDVILSSFLSDFLFFSSTQKSACDLLAASGGFSTADRGGWQVKP